VRVSALRSLALLRDARAAGSLVRRGAELLAEYRAQKTKGGRAQPAASNELLEVAAALGRLLANTGHAGASGLFRGARGAGLFAPEVEIALARVAPAEYVRDEELAATAARLKTERGGDALWQRVSAFAQGLGEIAAGAGEQAGGEAAGPRAAAQALLRSMLAAPHTPAPAAPDVLRALAAYKPADLARVAREQLRSADVIARATAADVLGELPPDEENARALAAALPGALRDPLNDAALSILGALARQRGEAARAAARAALDSPDYLVRRRAAEVLRGGAGGAGTRPPAETVNTRNRE
jgi:hypothetical protein